MVTEAAVPEDVDAGREAAARAVLGWLHDRLRPKLCLVTGAPATGKSRLLAVLAAAGAFDERANAIVPLTGLTPTTAAWAFAEQLRLPGRTPATLLAALDADRRDVTVVVAALDESGVAQDGAAARELVDVLLQPMLTLPHVRMLVESRPEALDGLSAPAEVIGLDAPEWTDRAGFTDWIVREAAALGVTDPRAVNTAGAFYPNVGLTRLALAAGPGDGVVGRWLARVPAHARPAVEALAEAREPVDPGTWRAWTAALTGDPARADAAVAALAPVVRTAGDGRVDLPCRPVRAAVLDARAPELVAQIGQAIGYAVSATVPGGDWSRAAPYAVRQFARHCAAAGVADRALADAGHLVHGDPRALTAAVEAAGDRAPGRLAAAWRLAGPGLSVAPPPADRAALLATAALDVGDDGLAARLAAFGADAAWWPEWVAAGSPGRARPGPVSALALHDGELLAAAADGPLHRLAPTDGAPRGRWRARARTVTGLAASGTDLLALDTNGVAHPVERRPGTTARPAAINLDDPVASAAEHGPPRPAAFQTAHRTPETREPAPPWTNPTEASADAHPVTTGQGVPANGPPTHGAEQGTARPAAYESMRGAPGVTESISPWTSPAEASADARSATTGSDGAAHDAERGTPGTAERAPSQVGPTEASAAARPAVTGRDDATDVAAAHDAGRGAARPVAFEAGRRAAGAAESTSPWTDLTEAGAAVRPAAVGPGNLSDGAAHGAERGAPGAAEPVSSSTGFPPARPIEFGVPSPRIGDGSVLAVPPGTTALGSDRAGTLVVMGDRDGVLHARRPRSDAPAERCAAHQGRVTAVACVSAGGDARVVLSGGADGTVRLWHVGGGLLDEPPARRGTAVAAVAAVVLPDGPLFAAAWVDGVVWAWHAAGEEMSLFPLGLPVRALALDADERGAVLYVGTGRGVTALRARGVLATRRG
ncbi:hypothetical protein [Actinomadura atramentaria]|uniref:hypothetical protein n=1 Tax=Actinomadura atramentaria TaxID=1990 RepID=UPI00047761BB|nr:hypothetical protein [Actinomadura atramentaria]